MKILKDRLKQLIREEMVNFPLLFENTMKEDFLKDFIEKYPQVKDESADSKIRDNTSKVYFEIRELIKKHYLSKQRIKSFVRFMQSLPNFEKEPAETIMKKYSVLRSEILKILDALPVEFIYVGDHTDRMYRTFNPAHTQSGGVVGSVYDEETKKVITNPYVYTNMLELQNALREEVYHAIDHNLSTTLIPMSKLQGVQASKLDIFLPRHKTGLSQERYNYLTSSIEFYAKMLRLKDIIVEKFPNKIDEDTGEIKPQFLFKLMQGKSEVLSQIGDSSVIEVLQVLDSSKIGKVTQFFNMVARAKKPLSTSQTA